MRRLITRLEARFPSLCFTPGEQFSWSPETGKIIYKAGASGKQSTWSLLHETGHALLKHRDYKADFELLQMEVAAWQRARQLAADLTIKIDNNHIEDCLDTYRDWLYQRSICPVCSTKCLQQGDFVHYRCFNCHAIWKVTASRFGRSYRRTKNLRSQMGAEAIAV